MKRTAAAFLAALMLMSLVACGEKEPEMTDEEKIAYIARQLANTSWMVQGSPYSTVYTFTINFDKDLSFHLYGESLLQKRPRWNVTRKARIFLCLQTQPATTSV